MKRRNRNRTGMTLIEVTIAITLVGVLMTGMLFAMRVSLDSLAKANGKLNANRRVTGAQRALEQEIAGFLPATAQMAAPDGKRNGLKVPFFQGEAQSMRFVSTYSLKEGSRGVPRILEFQVIPGGDSGGVRLVVNEWPYTGSQSTGAMVTGRETVEGVGLMTTFRPIEVAGNSFILADKLASCRFVFQEKRPRPEYQRWDEVWVKPEFPIAIRIEMQPQQDDPGRLKMISITAPVRVEKLPLETYVDQ